jgi:flagellar basal-body rod protein FlgF
MENTIFIALSRQTGLEQKMSVLANNIANVNTPGYRAQNTVFNQYLVEGEDKNKDIYQVLDYGEYMNTAAGSISQTGNPMDLAIKGDAYFAVQTPQGLGYTRAGKLTLNINNELVNPAGYPITDDGGNPIALPPNAKEFIVDEMGNISTDQGTIGKLNLVEFGNQQNLKAAGNGVYLTDDQGIPSTTSRVIQGAYEKSNVQGVLEMSRMIETSRDYQSLSRVLQGDHERQRSMIQKLTGSN